MLHTGGVICGGDFPANDRPSTLVDDQGHEYRSSPDRDVGEVGDPDLIRRRRKEIPVEQVRPCCCLECGSLHITV